ncbi:hypothetical protein, partial [Chryseobacterium indologenes]|uniref:hypothetical protein n=1 Tax=Chryseobacterium indologenes TaxID=253 RepID=UPI001E4B237A
TSRFPKAHSYKVQNFGVNSSRVFAFFRVISLSKLSLSTASRKASILFCFSLDILGMSVLIFSASLGNSGKV